MLNIGTNYSLSFQGDNILNNLLASEGSIVSITNASEILNNEGVSPTTLHQQIRNYLVASLRDLDPTLQSYYIVNVGPSEATRRVVIPVYAVDEENTSAITTVLHDLRFTLSNEEERNRLNKVLEDHRFNFAIIN